MDADHALDSTQMTLDAGAVLLLQGLIDVEGDVGKLYVHDGSSFSLWL
jgi:hypothetical protein